MRTSEFHFQTKFGPSVLYLRVDEDSSEQELEDEIGYWLSEIKLYEIDGDDKKAIMDAVKWMMYLLERYGD
jgi:hypothetical protein